MLQEAVLVLAIEIIAKGRFRVQLQSKNQTGAFAFLSFDDRKCNRSSATPPMPADPVQNLCCPSYTPQMRCSSVGQPRPKAQSF
jgi:hypothetical protein